MSVAWIALQASTSLRNEHNTLHANVLSPLIQSVIDRDGISHIIDLGCGDGGDTVAIARLCGKTGVKVIGVDYNEDFLRVARKNAADLGLSISYIEADLTDIDVSAKLRSAAEQTCQKPKILFLCLGNSIGIIPDWEACLRTIGDCISSGEKFLLVSHDKEQLVKKGVHEIYSKMRSYIGTINYEKSDLANGLFVSALQSLATSIANNGVHNANASCTKWTKLYW